MRKILVLSYQISPVRGSEYSVGWNYVVNMSRNNSLTVLYGASGNHLGDTTEIEDYISKNPINQVKFVPIRGNKRIAALNYLNKKGFLKYTFYFAYKKWHKLAYQKAKELTTNEKFDLIHFLNPIGFREPGFLWKLQLPYVWGPIGGVQNLPVKLFPALSLSGKLKFTIRALGNYFQFRFNRRLKKALKRSDVLLTATSENKTLFKKIHEINSIYFPENGLINYPVSLSFEKFEIETKQLIWIGSIDDRKALIILLKALELLEFGNYSLNIVGDGYLKPKLMKYAKDNNLHNIIWHGNLSREDVYKLLETSHMHISSSLLEGNPTVIWEAMSMNIPTITLDLSGMHDTICEKCGVKIPIKSYNQVIQDLAYVIDDFLEYPEKIQLLSQGVNDCAQKYTWDKRVEFFNEMYDKAIENFKRNERNE